MQHSSRTGLRQNTLGGQGRQQDLGWYLEMLRQYLGGLGHCRGRTGGLGDWTSSSEMGLNCIKWKVTVLGRDVKKFRAAQLLMSAQLLGMTNSEKEVVSQSLSTPMSRLIFPQPESALPSSARLACITAWHVILAGLPVGPLLSKSCALGADYRCGEIT